MTISYRIVSVRTLTASAGFGVLLALSACGGSGGGGSGTGGPPAATYTLGGTISGLPSSASGLVLANGTTTLDITGGATTFVFPTAIASGTAYAVSVKSAPTGLTCSVAGGSGTLTANTSNVVVTCSTQSFTVGGTIGLAPGASSGATITGLVLENGSDTLNVAAGATTFTMPSPVAYGSSYQVTVKTQPTNLSCAVSPAVASTMPANNVTNVAVTCTDQPYPLTGTVTVTGVAASDQGLVLTNSSNGDTYTFTTNATSFTMPMPVAYGAAYSVTATTQPADLTCAVNNGTGTMGAGNVTLNVSCADKAFALGGTVTINTPNGVTGLSDQGLVLTNTANSDTYTFNSNSGSFTMPLSVPYGSAYAISVTAQPTGLNCTVTNPSTTMPGNAVTNVSVTCSDRSFSLGGSISGLTASGLVLANNGADYTTILVNAGVYTMNTSVPYGASYALSVIQNPTGLSCTIAQSSGTMPAAAVTNAATSCVPIALSAQSYSFEGGTSDGATPFYSSLIQPVSGGYLYGLTGYGGANNKGTLFQYDPSTGNETVLHSFGSGNDGQFPEGSLVLASDGKLYAMTLNGGAQNNGTIVSYDLQSNTESLVYSFAGGNDGANPYGTLISASDGNLYGMTNSGGSVNNYGTLIEYNVQNGTESVLYRFAGGTDGAHPVGSLIQASDGNLYGLTDQGGAANVGTLFKWNTTTNQESVLHTFTGSTADGANPTGNLLQASDGNLYGMSVYGGANNDGTLYEYNLQAQSWTLLYSFAGGATDGRYPYGGLIQAPDGNLYGLSYQGGTANRGTIVEYNTHTNLETMQFSLPGGPGPGNPYGNLLQASDGNFYGLAGTGGTAGFGMVFKIN